MKNFRIVVEELTTDTTKETPTDSYIVVYSQCVDELDLRAVANAVMQKKRGPRAPKKEAK